MSSDVVCLNVGGRPMMTTRTTLTKYGDSLLGKMFDAESSEAPPIRLEDGAYFIDDDPEVFGVILNWLRYGSLDRKSASKLQLRTAARRYELHDLVETLSIDF